MDEKNTGEDPRLILRRLENLVKDIEFEKLELSQREPNIFNALSIGHHELSHSNFLAWLFDPKEGHGLGSLVLRRFLREVFSDDKSDSRGFIDADLMDVRNVEIRREWRNIDILIVLPEDVVVVENKVDTRDHSRQLSKYRQIVGDAFKNRKKHFVYLTPEGSSPQEEGEDEYYIDYSYHKIVEILERILEVYSENMPEKSISYIGDYTAMIRRNLLMNESINKKAMEIYRAHKEAIDFIIENRPDPASELLPYFEKAVTDAGLSIGSPNKGFIRFATPELMRLMPKGSEGWPNREPFLFEVDYYWSDRWATAKAIISPGAGEYSQRLLEAAKTIKGSIKDWREPTGKQWLTFWVHRAPFVASEMIAEEPEEIQKRASKIIEDIKPAVVLICEAVAKALPSGTRG